MYFSENSARTPRGLAGVLQARPLLLHTEDFEDDIHPLQKELNMELPEGMVAVVRGMQDAALCVTLLDGTRQYTLMPNAAVPQTPATYVQSTTKTEIVHGADGQEKCHCDSSVQAVDGRYTSIYKMAHCNVAPTSPPVTLTEFPPQKAELCPGQGNFEVGGLGSGENYCPTRNSGSFRGGMCWPDRGSVCTPRPSHSPDAFANSLRKYPSTSPERSTELVERLINYTQLKNSKNIRNQSPTRSETSTQNQDRLSRCSRRFDTELIQSGLEESPTRDRRHTEELEYRRVCGRSYDVRYVREVSKRVKDSVRNFSTYPYSHPVCPTIKERYDHLPPEQRNLAGLNVSLSVNTETQADVQMVSREVTTVPKVQPSVRNVAVPLTPSSSNSDAKPEKSIRTHSSSKSIQTTKALDLTLKLRKSVQTCFSSVDIQESMKVKNKRKSKSQEELRVNDEFEDEIVQLIQDLTSCPDLDRENVLRSKLLRRLRKEHKIDRSERVKIKIGRCIKDQLYSEIDLKNFTRELSNELISKIKRHNIFIGNNPTNVYRTDLHSFRTSHEDNCVEGIIKEWLNDIPIKSIDYLGREVKKGHLLHSIANKVRTLIINKLKYNSDSTMKADIIEIIEDIPIDVSGHNKRFYVNRLVTELMRKIKEIFTRSHSRRWRKGLEFPCKYIPITEKELNLFTREEVTEFTSKFRLKVCPETLKQIEMELTSILMESLEMIRLGNIEDVKEDILGMLADFVSISEHQAIYFANNVIYNLKDIFDQSNNIRKLPSQTFIVLQNSLHNTATTSKNNTDFTIEGITQGDIDANLDFYMNEIIQKINEWSTTIKGFDEIEPGFRQVVINDLAGDIVDRHKYLELNPSSNKTDIDELEHLKYQIFKWINKVVGEYNLDTIDRASELMEKIRSVPVPMLTKPQPNSKSTQPGCQQSCNATVPNLYSEAIQSTSKGRRFSSPDQFISQKQTRGNMKTYEPEQSGTEEYMNQIRKPRLSVLENSFAKPDRGSPQNETTESRFNASMGVTSTPKKNPPSADTAMAHTRMRQPQGPFVSMTEPPRDKANSKRRMSEPADYFSGPMRGNAGQRTDVERPRSNSRFGSPSRTNNANCCMKTSSKAALPVKPPSVKQLNDEYDQFVKNWVQQIPIVTSNPEEQALAEKARLGIYNGIWKAITKLKMNPSTMHNPFYYQDVFDDKLEELLNFLPQTSDLTNKKHKMKAQLIEKTTNTNELLVSAAGPSSYKQQLIDNVSNNLPMNKIDYTGKNEAKLYEEMQKMNLAEDFILYIKYREGDKVKANVFKKKLMKEVQELINNIKANYGKELKDIDAAAYIDEVIVGLQKVPLPSDDTIREEAEEINIGLEIEQWFSDLPLLPNDNYVEKLGRRRYKDALAKKIYDIEKQSSFTDCDSQMKEEVRRFLIRMPLRPGETENISFMVEELVNRLKNRPNDIVALGGARKSVAFMDANEYEDFSRDMPVCSSFSDSGKPAQANQSSYMIADGTRVKDSYPYAPYVNRRDVTPDSQQQWYTLDNTDTPPGSVQRVSRQDPSASCCRSQQAGPTDVPERTSNLMPITYSSSSQTPHLTAHDEKPREPGSYDKRNRSDSPRQIDHYSQRYELAPQRYEQGPQQFEQGQSSDYGPETESHGTGTHNLDRPRAAYEASCKSRRSSAPPSYRTEGSTKPMAVQTPDFQANSYFDSMKTAIPPAHCCDPGGYSTPQQNAPLPSSSRPKKRTKDVEKTRKESAKKRLVLEDTENESEEEVRCRCMEKVWRCRRKKSICPPYDENDYLPCYMRYPPYPYFF